MSTQLTTKARAPQLRGKRVTRLLKQRGSGTVLSATVILVLVVVAAAAFVLVSWVNCLHRARNAADLAALAGAEAFQAGLSACSAAVISATSNNATVTACHVRSNGFDFSVQVSVSIPLKPRLPFSLENVEAVSEAGVIG